MASGSGFSPIGDVSTPFAGTYDGGGHTIDSLCINRGSTSNIGLFGKAVGAVMKNLGVTNVNIVGMDETAPLGGYTLGCTILNCFATGSANGSYSGGLVSLASSDTIRNCYSRTAVSGTYLAGGFIQQLSYGIVEDCYSTGAATGGMSAGGFVEFVSNAPTISNCFWDTLTSALGTSAAGTGKTTAQMKTYATFDNAGWDLELESANGNNDYWDMDTSSQTVNDGYPFLSWQNGGSVALPVQMATVIVRQEGESIVLRWGTATEVDNAGWEVERRAISDFVKIGFVEGAGTSTSPKQYVFTDRSPLPAQSTSPITVSYRLKQFNRSGSFSYAQELAVLFDPDLVPRTLHLAQNFPNPFNPTTDIRYQIPEDGWVRLSVIDVLGREVVVLVSESQHAGVFQKTTFDASGLPSGMYFARLEAGGRQLLQRMVLLK